MVIESIKYSIPYVSLILFFILLFITEYIVRRQDRYKVSNLQITRWIGMGALMFFFGLRGFIGWDWTIYYPAFRDFPTLFHIDSGTLTHNRFEFGFVLYMSAIKTIWNNFHFFIFINTLIDILILVLFVKQYSKVSFSLSCILFIVMGGIYLETDLLRSSKSIMFFLLSLKFLQGRQPLQYFLINLIGCTFHISAVFFLPLYFFLHRSIPKKAVLVIFITGIIIFLLRLEYVRPVLLYVASFLGEKYTQLLDKYLHTELYSSAYGLTIGFAERVLTSVLIIIYYDKLIKQNKTNILFINGYILFFIFFFYFAEIKVIPMRVGGLFYFAYWIIYPALYNAIENKNNKKIFLVFIFVYSIIKIEGIGDNLLYRYDNVLTGIQAVEERLKIFNLISPVLLK